MAQYEADTGKAVVKIAGVCGPTEQRAGSEARHFAWLRAVLLSPGGLNDRTEDYLLERTPRRCRNSAGHRILSPEGRRPVVNFHMRTGSTSAKFPVCAPSKPRRLTAT